MSALVPSHDPSDPADFRDPTDLSEFAVYATEAGRLLHVHRPCNRGIGSATVYTVRELLAEATAHTCPIDDGADQ